MDVVVGFYLKDVCDFCVEWYCWGVVFFRGLELLSLRWFCEEF